MWALLKSFNEQLSPAMPFILQQGGLADQNLSASNLQLTVASYLATTRNLGLLCVKSDLRHLIMDKTALPVSDGNIPNLVFERMQIMKSTRKEESKSEPFGSMIQNPWGDKSTEESDGAEEPKSKGKTDNTIFMKAFEQVKNMGEGALARLRPVAPLPGKGETHHSFKVIFKGEKVEGDGGPYR